MPKLKSGSTMKIDGLPVRDLTKPLRLIITDEDCRKGNSKVPSSCAAALAAKRLPQVTEARIHIARVLLKVANKYWLRGRTPGALRTEIVSFDRGGKFEPGEYMVKPLSPSDRASGKQQGTNPPKRKGATKKRHIHILESNIRSNAHVEYSSKRK